MGSVRFPDYVGSARGGKRMEVSEATVADAAEVLPFIR